MNMKKKVCCLLIVALALAALSLCAACGRKSDEDSVYAEGGYIKYIDFDVPFCAMRDALAADISSYGAANHICWIEILAYLASKNGGNFSSYKSADVKKLMGKLSDGSAVASHVSNTKLYNYYIEAYGAILGGMVGEYTEVKVSGDGAETRTEKYGLRVFSPIAAGYYYSDFDDFGASRSYGYRREHLGHDLMGSIGTPVIAVESGYVEACGWNQYGGWRIGIRSFDGLRYYYYAHLRKSHPYNDMYAGKIVNAGEVIGYLGMTGYSTRENTNNIDTPHLHYGLQIIFDPSQKDGWNQIWIDMYELTRFFTANRAQTVKKDGESYSKIYYIYPETPD
jgi:murein DD-endopeptidase MepM/ murein hydrolase activator NlpD